MYWGNDGFRPYVSVAERQRQARLLLAKLRKQGQEICPVTIAGRAIASTFWGKAWCDNLEAYSDYANRLPRGRTYVRNGSVIDLQIKPGLVTAMVSGSEVYKTEVAIDRLAPARWKKIAGDCAGHIDSVVELLAGRLDKGVMARLCERQGGLFPAPKEMHFHCSCPDWASMCKHVAAVLYGVGARLDERPDLLFTLRQVDEKELIARAGAGIAARKPAAGRTLDEADLGAVFGIDLAEAEPPVRPPAPTVKRRRRPATITAVELIARGIPRSTFQRWVTAGHLVRTDRRGVYQLTPAAEKRIGGWSARR